MKIDKDRLIIQSHQFFDICLTAGSFILAYFIKKYLLPESFRGLSVGPNYYIILLMIIIIWYIAFNLFNLYASYRKQPIAQILWGMIKSVSTAILFMILIMYIIKMTDVSRIMMGIFFLLNIGFLTLSKIIIYKILSSHKEN